MSDEFMTTLEVAHLLGVKEWGIRYQIRAGRVRLPMKVVSGNYLWQPAEVRDLARALDVPVPESLATRN
ncbi:hypothetical protein ACFL09_04565 [Planctomycetota bacterium]